MGPRICTGWACQRSSRVMLGSADAHLISMPMDVSKLHSQVVRKTLTDAHGNLSKIVQFSTVETLPFTSPGLVCVVQKRLAVVG